MPASLATVKRKIQSTKSTRQITSAMQMVSTAKLN
ncbi:F0F1 ATP synthase subunit gamma, partial [Limosilactobacillus mucosae]|nr:F0F1 ATP synthase subunit gamma [Limosilactobacillus mucosae]